MRKIILYIAMSLDGYIADENGKVDWLNVEGEDDYDSYASFIQNVDTVIMGRNTYDQVVNELSDIWPYENQTSYIFTHETKKSTENIKFVNTDVKELLHKLKEENGKDIWICGGANLVSKCVKEDLIDVYHIAIIPTILGKGIRLFDHAHDSIPIKFVESKQYNGICEWIYERK